MAFGLLSELLSPMWSKLSLWLSVVREMLFSFFATLSSHQIYDFSTSASNFLYNCLILWKINRFQEHWGLLDLNWPVSVSLKVSCKLQIYVLLEADGFASEQQQTVEMQCCVNQSSHKIKHFSVTIHPGSCLADHMRIPRKYHRKYKEHNHNIF